MTGQVLVNTGEVVTKGGETGRRREEDGSMRKQAEDTRRGFQDWDSSGSYSQQRNSILSSVIRPSLLQIASATFTATAAHR